RQSFCVLLRLVVSFSCEPGDIRLQALVGSGVLGRCRAESLHLSIEAARLDGIAITRGRQRLELPASVSQKLLLCLELSRPALALMLGLGEVLGELLRLLLARRDQRSLRSSSIIPSVLERGDLAFELLVLGIFC